MARLGRAHPGAFVRGWPGSALVGLAPAPRTKVVRVAPRCVLTNRLDVSLEVCLCQQLDGGAESSSPARGGAEDGQIIRLGQGQVTTRLASQGALKLRIQGSDSWSGATLGCYIQHIRNNSCIIAQNSQQYSTLYVHF